MGVSVIGIAAYINFLWRYFMMLDQAGMVPVVLLIGTSLALLLSNNWRMYVIVLSIQYLAASWLITLVWPVGLAAVKLVVGWMAGAVIGASQLEKELSDDNLAGISGRLFRFLAAGLVWLVVFSVEPLLLNLLPTNVYILRGGLLLIGMGLLQLGMTTHILRVIVGLLTLLTGFEILYAAVEASVLVAGLLAIINLGLAMVGTYLLTSSTMELEL